MKYSLFFLGLLGILPLVYSQSKQAEFDSLFQKAIRLDAIASPQAFTAAIKAITYAEQTAYNPGILKGTLWICEHYIRNGNDAQALLFAAKAEKKEPFLKGDSSVKLKRIKARSLIRMGFYEEADKTLQEALTYALKLKGDKNIPLLGAVYTDMGTNYAERNVTSHLAIEYYQKGLQLFQKMKDSDPLKPQYTFWVLVKIASFYRKQRHPAKARQYLKTAALYSGQLKNNLGKTDFYYNKGIESNTEGKIDEAKQYFQKALDIVKRERKITCKKELYYELFRVCQNLKKTDSCRYYRQQYILYSDSLHQMYRKDASAALRFFEKEKQQEIRERSVVYFLILLICILLILLGITKLFRDHKKFIILLEEKIAIEERLQKNESNLNQIKKKNNLEVGTTVTLRRLVKEGNPAFLIEFKKLYPDFYDRLLVYNSETGNDMKFCALIRLNYTTIQMAKYTKSTIRAVESRKYRLRKKFNIPKDKNIYEWFQEF